MNWMQSHVGLIHWNSYWKTYSLVLSVSFVDGIVELDNFGGINYGSAVVRHHNTALNKNDKFYTIKEFSEMVQSKQVKSVDVNGKENKFQ